MESTRAELYGILVAYCEDGPVHAAVDNASAVGTTAQLIQVAISLHRHMGEGDPRWGEIIARPLGKRHLQLSKNGDIISWIWKVILAKGVNSIRRRSKAMRRRKICKRAGSRTRTTTANTKQMKWRVKQ